MGTTKTKQDSWMKKLKNARITAVEQVTGSSNEQFYVIRLSNGITVIPEVRYVAGAGHVATLVFRDEGKIASATMSADDLTKNLKVGRPPRNASGFPVINKPTITKPFTGEMVQGTLFDKDGKERPIGEPSEWLSTAQAAKYLKISKGTLLNMSYDKRIPYYKLGRLNRYNKRDLQDLIASNLGDLKTKG